jgi:trk system potassium uptake protein TrkA
VVGRKIEEIELPEGTTIPAIVRGEDVIIAHHDTVVIQGDHVLLFVPDKRSIAAIEQLFQVGATFI